MIEAPVSGINFDPAQAPSTQDHFIYGYVDQKTYTDITGEAANQKLILRLKNVATKQDIQTRTDPILADLGRMGISVDTVNILKPNEHPHQFQLNTLLLLVGAIGLLAFLMGAVLVTQLMGAILMQQTRQIGVLKAIGATRWHVLRIYLTMVLLLGLAASMIAIPLALFSGYAFAQFVAGIINFNILTTRLPLHLYASLVVAGLLLPVLLSLPALLKGVNASVQDALSDYGIVQENTGRAGQSLFSYRVMLALRNTLRRKKRVLVTVATMALGVAIFSTGFNVRQALADLLADSRNAMKHDVQVVFKEQISLQDALLPFKSLGNVSRVEAWNGGTGLLQTKSIATTDGIGIVALPYDTDLLRLKVISGRWLQASDEPEVVMNQQAIETLGNPVVGEHYSLNMQGKVLKVKLVGVVQEFGLAKIYLDKKLYDAWANPDHLINSLMFVAQDKRFDKIFALKKDIERAIA